MGQELQRRPQVVGGGVERRVDGRFVVRFVAIARQGRAEARLHLGPEALLELGITAKAELGDEASDGRRAHARALGEPRHALESGDRIGSKEHAGQPPLGRAEAVQALPDDLPDSATSRFIHYISFQFGAS